MTESDLNKGSHHHGAGNMPMQPDEISTAAPTLLDTSIANNLNTGLPRYKQFRYKQNLVLSNDAIIHIIFLRHKVAPI